VQAWVFASDAIRVACCRLIAIPLNLSWTGLAMRVARYFPMVVVTGLVCQATIPLIARASDSAAIDSADQSSEPQTNGRIVDGAVQQANFYDSRPRANSTMIAPPGSGPDQRSGALFHGESLHMPTSWFGRQTQSSRSANHTPQAAAKQSVTNQPNPNNGQIRPRVANQPAVASRPMQQRVVNGRAMQPAAVNNQNFRNPAGQTPIPIHQDMNPRPMPLANRPMPAAKPAPNSSAVSPWGNPPVAAAAATGAIAGSVAVATSAKPSGPMSAADKLVAQAHTLSAAAKTEQDYSRIIETCRRAQASQASLETAKYANNLTAWAFNRRGQLKAEAGHDKDAILDFDDAIRAESTCWRAVHNRGVLLAQAGQFEKAFDDFSRTIQVNPQFAKAYSNRAALFMVANNLNAAHQDYKHAIELDANLAVAHRGCGRVCQLMGKLDDAVLHYDAAVQLAPNDAYAAACRADLLTDIGRYSDALAEYNRALQIDPKSSQANCGSAWLLATCPDSALRNSQLAVERANQAIELGSQKDAVSFDSLAAAQASAGDFAGAMQSIHKAIELAPTDERDSYKDRLVMYQQAKPYRIAPVERLAQQASYQTK
jgi:tetratricopeptide (TPR) repeat protein